MSRIAVVTGANQGLGLALVRALAARLDPDDIVYMGARDEARGRKALESLGKTRASVRLARIDVTDPGTITAFTEKLRAEHGGVDLVASNAAARMSKDRPQAEQVRGCCQTKTDGSRIASGA